MVKGKFVVYHDDIDSPDTFRVSFSTHRHIKEIERFINDRLLHGLYGSKEEAYISILSAYPEADIVLLEGRFYGYPTFLYGGHHLIAKQHIKKMTQITKHGEFVDG